MEYKIKKEDKKNPKDTLIEVSGLTDVISIKQILDNIEALEGQVTELSGKIGVEEATMKNVVDNHPKVGDLLPNSTDTKEVKEEKNLFLVAMFIFLKSRDYVQRARPIVKERKDIIKEETVNLEKIKEVTGIKYE